jgi:hypothetical protein
MYDEGKSGYWISETKEIKIHTLAPKCLLVDTKNILNEN